MRAPTGVLALLTAVLLSVVSAVPAAPKGSEGDWPWWRGPSRNGASADRRAPTKWSATTNIVWKTKVPGRGHSSPIVCGDRVFLTTADETAKRQSVLAFDRKTGRPLWTTLAHEGGFPVKNPKNSHASATPACDGKRVYSPFLHDAALYVTATDLDGKIVWQKKVGSFRSQHGYGASPVLYKSLVIVSGDSLKDCFLAALDTASGKVVWWAKRKASGRNGDYGTPIVATLNGRPQLILTGMGEVSSYDPETGKRLWWCAGPSEVTGCTPACSDTLVFATGGFPEKNILAIRADGHGDVTDSHIVWRSRSGVSYVPSPLYHDGRLYIVNDSGVATCFDARSGKQVWQDRIAGAFTASPVLVGDLLYATNESGRTYLLKTGPKFAVAGTNDVGERVLATPAVCGGQVFLRGERHLFCIGRAAATKRD